MIRVNTKQLSRIEWLGQLITNDRSLGGFCGEGYKEADVAIGDATQVVYIKVLPDKKHVTTVRSLLRAIAWRDGQAISCQRVLSDNSGAYRSRLGRES